MKVSETPFRKLNGDPLRIFHSVLYRGLPPFHSIAASSHSGLKKVLPQDETAIAVLMMLTAVAVIFFIHRYLAGRRRHFGHRLPNSFPNGSGGALFGGEDKPLHG